MHVLQYNKTYLWVKWPGQARRIPGHFVIKTHDRVWSTVNIPIAEAAVLEISLRNIHEKRYLKQCKLHCLEINTFNLSNTELPDIKLWRSTLDLRFDTDI